MDSKYIEAVSTSSKSLFSASEYIREALDTLNIAGCENALFFGDSYELEAMQEQLERIARRLQNRIR